MRALIVMVILAALVAAYQTKPARTEHSARDKASESAEKGTNKSANPSPSAVQNAINAEPAKNPSQNVARNSTTDTPEWVNFLNAISTLVIALFTVGLFIGLVVQIRTGRAIERAWIMAEIQPDPEEPSDGRLHIFQGSGSYGENTAAMNAALICSNAGKTPAWIEEIIAKFEMVKTLSKIPSFEGAQSIQHSTIPLGMSEGGATPHSQTIQWKPVAQGHQSADEMAVIYGRVTYRDIFGKKRITTFGYKVMHRGHLQRLDGHPKYNENT